jgi:hypothetical protein
MNCINKERETSIEEEKSVAWHTDGRSLEKHGVPRESTTTSRVIILGQGGLVLTREARACPIVHQYMYHKDVAAHVMAAYPA